MNIHDPAWKSFQHRRFQNPHETSEHYQVDTGVAQHSHEFCLSLQIQSCAKFSGREIGIWDGEFARDLENWCVQHIRNHYARFGLQSAVPNFFQNCATIASLS